MLRDGAIAYLAPRNAMPLDLPVSPDARASSLAPVVPAHTVVSGLAGLWIRRGGPAPGVVDLVGRRGLHRAKPGADARGWTLAFHSGRAADGTTDRIGGVRVPATERCAADALRWAPAAEAIRAVYGFARDGLLDVRALDDVVRSDDPRGKGAARERSAWAAIAAGSRRAGPQWSVRRLPVMRRTS